MAEKNYPLKLISAESIEPKEVKWLWYPFIPIGKVTIVQGDPGDGKSTFMLKLAALMTKGEPFPFTEDESSDPKHVIYQTTEDDADDTVVPRFLNAGGDPKHLTFIDESEKAVTFADERIAEAIKETGAKMLVLDPLSSYIGDCALNQANEVRPRFNYLIKTARENECAIVIVDHMNKASQTKAIYRTPGTIDVVGAARSTLIIGRDPEYDDRRILVQQKANLAPTGNAIVFSVDGNGVEFLEEKFMTADELLATIPGQPGRPAEKMEAAVLMIEEMLKDGEPIASSECMEKLLKAGFRRGTIMQAKKQAGVDSTKVGGQWFWSMPARNQEFNNPSLRSADGETNIEFDDF